MCLDSEVRVFSSLCLQLGVNRHIQIVDPAAVGAGEVVMRFGIAVKMISSTTGNFQDHALIAQKGQIAVYRAQADRGHCFTELRI